MLKLHQYKTGRKSAPKIACISAKDAVGGRAGRWQFFEGDFNWRVLLKKWLIFANFDSIWAVINQTYI